MKVAGQSPFSGADEAWFWAMEVLTARQDGAGLSWRPEGSDRPCEPEDVFTCVDRLYQEGSITLAHARVIRRWGLRQRQPPVLPGYDHRLWHQAMGLLEWRLRARELVADPTTDSRSL